MLNTEGVVRMNIGDEKQFIYEIMRDYGGPMTSREIFRLSIAKAGLEERSFRSNILRRAIDHSGRIIAKEQPGTRGKLYELSDD